MAAAKHSFLRTMLSSTNSVLNNENLNSNSVFGDSNANSFNGHAGATQTRLADPGYEDSYDSPAGTRRKSAREISNLVGKQEFDTENARQLSDMVWAWGQFIDHDIVDTQGGSEQFNIEIPEDDPLLNRFPGVSHFDFTRSHAVVDGQGVRQQQNVTTALIDASAVYGFTEETTESLRTGEGGKLKTHLEQGELLPILTGRQGPEFHAGDHRATENPLLSSVHTIWVREHNRLSDEIAEQSPGLSDQEIFDKAKAIVTGLIQNITYNEFLPALLVNDSLDPYEGYDSSVDPGISTEFATAAFRIGHTLISNGLTKVDTHGHSEESIALKDSFFNIQHLLDGDLDSILNGASQTVAQEIDTKVVDGLRDFLFSGAPAGSDGTAPALDLAARNIQRGRDHGIADYNSLRVAVGLEATNSFNEISSNPEVVAMLQEAYATVDDIDAFVGGLAEDHVNGGSVGELFSTIIANQFANIRTGDENWFEINVNGLSQNEIEAIRVTTFADVIKRNSGLQDLEENVFFVRDDVIRGSRGDDVLGKGGGDDTLFAFAGNDFLIGGLGDDNLHGGSGDDTLSGGAGDDRLIGGNGSDIAIFSGLFEDYVINRLNSTAVQVIDTRTQNAEGTDTLTSIEILRFKDQDFSVEDPNSIPELRGSPVGLTDGFQGSAYILNESDLLHGYFDADGDPLSITAIRVDSENGSLEDNENGTWTYRPSEDAEDVVFDFEVIDGNGGMSTGSTTLTLNPPLSGAQPINTVMSSRSITLGHYDDHLVLFGPEAIDGTGNHLSNIITGNNADNVIDGGGGIDILRGRDGDDTYVVDNRQDRVIESVGKGVDTVQSTFSYKLSSNVENLKLLGGFTGSKVNGIGNRLNNILEGNIGENRLVGRAGSDTLIGGLGRDVLSGGADADSFVYHSIDDSGTTAQTRDVITDFSTGDIIDLSNIDAQHLIPGHQVLDFVGSEAFSESGQVRFENGLLSVNTDDDLDADFQVRLRGVTELLVDSLIL